MSSSSSVRNVNSFESVLVGRLTDLGGGSGRLPQQHVNLLLDPLLVVRRVRVGRLLVHEAAQVRELEEQQERKGEFQWKLGSQCRLCNTEGIVLICNMRFYNSAP